MHLTSRAFPSYTSPQLTVSPRELSALSPCLHGVLRLGAPQSHMPSSQGWKIFLRLIRVENVFFLPPPIFLLLKKSNTRELKVLGFSFSFLSSLIFFNWGTGIWVTWALALFLEAGDTNGHHNSGHDPRPQSEAFPQYPCTYWRAVSWRSPPRISWYPPTCSSPVSPSVVSIGFSLFLLIKHLKQYFSQWDLKPQFVCKRLRRHYFQELEIIMIRYTDTHMTWSCPQVKVTYNH